MNTADSDLIIVGAGILGLSAAIQAAEQGLKVQLFEKDAAPAGATRRNFGMVGTSTLSRPDAKWREYALETRKFYQRIQAQHDISFQQRNGLYLANTELEWQVLHEFAQAAPDYRIPVELLNRQQLFEKYAYLNPETKIRGAMLFQEDYSVEPHLAGSRLLQHAQQLGVEIHCNACVVRARSKDGLAEIQLASGQRHAAAKVLICHGEVTQILYPEILQQLGLQRCSLQMALTRPLAHELQASIYSGLSISRYPAFEICPSHQALIDESQQGLVKKYGILRDGYPYNLQMDTQNQTMAFSHGDLLFVFNWHPSASIPNYEVRVRVPGRYRPILSTDERRFGGTERTDMRGQHFSYPVQGDELPRIRIYNTSRTATVFLREE